MAKKGVNWSGVKPTPAQPNAGGGSASGRGGGAPKHPDSPTAEQTKATNGKPTEAAPVAGGQQDNGLRDDPAGKVLVPQNLMSVEQGLAPPIPDPGMVQEEPAPRNGPAKPQGPSRDDVLLDIFNDKTAVETMSKLDVPEQQWVLKNLDRIGQGNKGQRRSAIRNAGKLMNRQDGGPAWMRDTTAQDEKRDQQQQDRIERSRESRQRVMKGQAGQRPEPAPQEPARDTDAPQDRPSRAERSRAARERVRTGNAGSGEGPQRSQSQQRQDARGDGAPVWDQAAKDQQDFEKRQREKQAGGARRDEAKPDAPKDETPKAEKPTDPAPKPEVRAATDEEARMGRAMQPGEQAGNDEKLDRIIDLLMDLPDRIYERLVF